MAFSSYKALSDFFLTLGVRRILCKPLSENDNTKQQIYLGGSFEALNQLPFSDIKMDNLDGKPNFKAKVDYWWVDEDMHYQEAPYTQLILYPKYPEVRLSGFLSGCPIAPRELLQPIPRNQREGQV